MCRNITANDRGYRGCISLRLGACYALRFMCLKADKPQLCANIPINSVAYTVLLSVRRFLIQILTSCRILLNIN